MEADPGSLAKGSEYRCARCAGVYLSTGFDAQAELEENFPEWKNDPCEIVCDDCYKQLLWLLN